MPGSEPAKEGRPHKQREAEERRLVEAAQRDTSRFGDVYEHYFEIVYAYVARRVRNRTEAEDMTAEVFRKTLQSLPRFKWTGAPFAAWLFRVASNIIADRAKRAAREGNVPGDEDVRELRVPQPQQIELEQSERSANLFRLVSELSGDQHKVLIMRFVEEKSILEIASALGRSEGAVKQLQFRALASVRKRLDSGEWPI
jgi:RNA polymerase sigma-70 factor (ECF subfamily)